MCSISPSVPGAMEGSTSHDRVIPGPRGVITAGDPSPTSEVGGGGGGWNLSSGVSLVAKCVRSGGLVNALFLVRSGGWGEEEDWAISFARLVACSIICFRSSSVSGGSRLRVVVGSCRGPDGFGGVDKVWLANVMRLLTTIPQSVMVAKVVFV